MKPISSARAIKDEKHVQGYLASQLEELPDRLDGAELPRVE